MANINVASTADGLNRLTAIAGSGTDHDARGNVVWVPATGSTTGVSRGFAYTSDNALAIAANATSYNEMYYDSVDRLLRYHDGGAYRFFLYDGQSLVVETNAAATAIARRYVHGPGIDEPLVWYEGAGTSTRRWFHADERGSVIAVSDAAGDVVTAVNRYDDYGAPQGNLTGRFGYTGQPWFAEIGLYHYRARAYNPALGGRFMQSDPIGYNGGMNLYAYVGNNPVNRTDPSGLGGNGVSEGDADYCDYGRFWDADPRHACVNYPRYVYFDISTVGGAGNQGGSGTGDGDDRPPICRGVSRTGNNVRITTPVEFYDGNYPQRIPNSSTPRSSSDVADYYLNIFNSGRWNRALSPYVVDVNMTRGGGGLTAFVGDTVSSGIVGGGTDPYSGTMWLHTPTEHPAYDALLADHELGHSFGNPHSQDLVGYVRGQAPNLMDRLPSGPPLASHIETLLRVCGLN